MLSTITTLIVDQVTLLVTFLAALMGSLVAVLLGFHGLKVGLRKVKYLTGFGDIDEDGYHRRKGVWYNDDWERIT